MLINWSLTFILHCCYSSSKL